LVARNGSRQSAKEQPMSGFYDEVQELKGRYPDWRSATLPALQLAQEKHGYLSPQALRETAAALGTTPAFCESVASFYDMLHLAPVGRHMVEVCTNLPCALCGAQRVVDAFEEALGIAPGETTEDGAITFRTVECLGGCGYATVVSIDERYRHFVSPEKVPAMVEELRAS
jgi:NADH-quinone oxidoreductase E subunit